MSRYRLVFVLFCLCFGVANGRSEKVDSISFSSQAGNPIPFLAPPHLRPINPNDVSAQFYDYSNLLGVTVDVWFTLHVETPPLTTLPTDPFERDQMLSSLAAIPLAQSDWRGTPTTGNTAVNVKIWRQGLVPFNTGERVWVEETVKVKATGVTLTRFSNTVLIANTSPYLWALCSTADAHDAAVYRIDVRRDGRSRKIGFLPDTHVIPGQPDETGKWPFAVFQNRLYFIKYREGKYIPSQFGGSQKEPGCEVVSMPCNLRKSDFVRGVDDGTGTIKSSVLRPEGFVPLTAKFGKMCAGPDGNLYFVVWQNNRDVIADPGSGHVHVGPNPPMDDPGLFDNALLRFDLRDSITGPNPPKAGETYLVAEFNYHDQDVDLREKNPTKVQNGLGSYAFYDAIAFEPQSYDFVGTGLGPYDMRHSIRLHANPSFFRISERPTGPLFELNQKYDYVVWQPVTGRGQLHDIVGLAFDGKTDLLYLSRGDNIWERGNPNATVCQPDLQPRRDSQGNKLMVTRIALSMEPASWEW